MTTQTPEAQYQELVAAKHGPNWKHGMSAGGHPIYAVWASMVARCHRQYDKSYPRYGGRGIHVCKHWRKFPNFVEDMLASYEKHSFIHGRKNTQIDRIENRKGYNPGNVRWATLEEQARNKPSKSNTTSRFKGVSKVGKRWQAEIRAGKIRKYLGVFKAEKDAARAYDVAAKELHGDFAYLNFPHAA